MRNYFATQIYGENRFSVGADSISDRCKIYILGAYIRYKTTLFHRSKTVETGLFVYYISASQDGKTVPLRNSMQMCEIQIITHYALRIKH